MFDVPQRIAAAQTLIASERRARITQQFARLAIGPHQQMRAVVQWLVEVGIVKAARAAAQLRRRFQNPRIGAPLGQAESGGQTRHAAADDDAAAVFRGREMGVGGHGGRQLLHALRY
ncbi:hypothetical protein MAIT1_01543 [Magnetofaba australis IT-1]|uniref:Uncharacterized protein n=1 Tax=Magnetofaba australis IT-1 TaxID=1434232 RepID=A0A1Y2K1R1_9PROT|nr:hypothetical protein MAIT1_01543 [Magnetofaba australis IT-1]